MTYPAGSTVYSCPLPECGWTLNPDDPDPASAAVATAALKGSVSHTPGEMMTAIAKAIDKALEAHLSTHTTLEWVREIARLSGIVGKVAAELADDGRIGRSLLTGARATRANLAREECLDLLDLSGERRRLHNLTSSVADLEAEHGPASAEELAAIREEWPT